MPVRARLGHAVAGDLAARASDGRYRLLTLHARASAAARMPQVRLRRHDRLPRSAAGTGAGAAAARRRCAQRLARGEQSLVFLNRRGYAPVLHCGACGWKSGCPHCSAWRVFHKADRTLRCHHCGFDRARAARLPGLRQPATSQPVRPRHRAARGAAAARCCPAARIARIDADSTRGKAARWSAARRRARRRGRRAGGHPDGGQGPRLPPHHAGGGGQRRRGAVRQRLPRARAPVRAADAGRRPRRPRRRAGRRSEMLDPDRAPRAPAVRARWRAHDFAALRRRASWPSAARPASRRSPSRRCCAPRRRALADALDFLARARRAGADAGARCGAPLRSGADASGAPAPTVERAQLLVESAQRPALQAFLQQWVGQLNRFARGARSALACGCGPSGILGMAFAE
ncbi:MAG: hypothetical protein MZW92_76245 [Comamonadaceae bacterium]|nr:hypothetical protein [Comamonadaceae bacterium]